MGMGREPGREPLGAAATSDEGEGSPPGQAAPSFPLPHPPGLVCGLSGQKDLKRGRWVAVAGPGGSSGFLVGILGVFRGRRLRSPLQACSARAQLWGGLRSFPKPLPRGTRVLCDLGWALPALGLSPSPHPLESMPRAFQAQPGNLAGQRPPAGPPGTGPAAGLGGASTHPLVPGPGRLVLRSIRHCSVMDHLFAILVAE